MKYEDKLQPFDTPTANVCARLFSENKPFKDIVKTLKDTTSTKRVVNYETLKETTVYDRSAKLIPYKHGTIIINHRRKQALGVTRSGKLWFFDMRKNHYFYNTPDDTTCLGRVWLQSDLWSVRHGWGKLNNLTDRNNVFTYSYLASSTSTWKKTKMEALAHVLDVGHRLTEDENFFLVQQIANMFVKNRDESPDGTVIPASLEHLGVGEREIIYNLCNRMSKDWYSYQTMFKINQPNSIDWHFGNIKKLRDAVSTHPIDSKISIETTENTPSPTNPPAPRRENYYEEDAFKWTGPSGTYTIFGEVKLKDTNDLADFIEHRHIRSVLATGDGTKSFTTTYFYNTAHKWVVNKKDVVKGVEPLVKEWPHTFYLVEWDKFGEQQNTELYTATAVKQLIEYSTDEFITETKNLEKCWNFFSTR